VIETMISSCGFAGFNDDNVTGVADLHCLSWAVLLLIQVSIAPSFTLSRGFSVIEAAKDA
jgi:hypothetical protein